MKTLLFLFSLLCVSAQAAPSLLLEWGPSPDADVINYRLYWGPGSGNYNAFRDLGNITNTVFIDFSEGMHLWFVVTAMNAEGAESDPSNEIDFLFPRQILPPGTLHFTITVQTSSNLVTWADAGAAVMASTNPAAFYRLKVDAPAVAPAIAATPAARKAMRSPFDSVPMARKPSKPALRPPAPPVPTVFTPQRND